jgi:hypothetical protein
MQASGGPPLRRAFIDLSPTSRYDIAKVAGDTDGGV